MIEVFQNVITKATRIESNIVPSKRRKKFNVPADQSVGLSELTKASSSKEILPRKRSKTNEIEESDVDEQSTSDEEIESVEEDRETSKRDDGNCDAMEAISDISETDNNNNSVNNVNDIEEHNFVIVAFKYNIGTKKKCSKNFVYQVEKIGKTGITVNCMRSSNSKNNVFIFPTVPDIATVQIDDILKLEAPSLKTGKFTFKPSLF